MYTSSISRHIRILNFTQENKSEIKSIISELILIISQLGFRKLKVSHNYAPFIHRYLRGFLKYEKIPPKIRANTSEQIFFISEQNLNSAEQNKISSEQKRDKSELIGGRSLVTSIFRQESYFSSADCTHTCAQKNAVKTA